MNAAVQVASLFGVIDLKDNLTPGLKEAKGGLTAFGDDLQSLGGRVTQFGGSLTALGLPFLGVAAKAQMAFDEMDDAADQLNAVLKSTGGQVGLTQGEILRMADGLQDLTAITRPTIVAGQNMLLTFTNIGGKVFPRATTAMLDLSVAMKQDLKSSAIQLGKALNDPMEGITALTRVGVTFTETQKQMIQTMVEAGDIAGAQGLILTELEREFGGSAAAAVDPIDRLGVKINDLAITLGASLQPALESVIGFVDGIIDGLNGFLGEGNEVVGMVIILGAGLAVIGPILAGIGLAISSIGVLLAGPFLPIALIVAGLLLIADHFNITFEQIGVYMSLFKLYAEYYFSGVVTAIGNIITALGAGPGGLIAAVVVAVGAGGLGAFAAILGGPLGIVALTAALIGWMTQQPGGLLGVISRAAEAARQLATMLALVISKIQQIANSNLQTGATAVGNIASGVASGQFSIPQVIGAIGAEIRGTPQPVGPGATTAQQFLMNNPYSRDSGGRGEPGQPYYIGTGAQPELFTPDQPGTFTPAGAGGGLQIGTVNVYADSYTGGQDAARGFKDEMRRRG